MVAHKFSLHFSEVKNDYQRFNKLNEILIKFSDRKY